MFWDQAMPGDVCKVRIVSKEEKARYEHFIKLNFGKVLGCSSCIRQKTEKNNLGNNVARRIMEIIKCI